MVKWSLDDASDTYGVPYWGAPYFSVGSSGQIEVHPSAEPKQSARLADIVDDLVKQGFRPPLILRFPQIIRHRLSTIQAAFEAVIRDASYQGGYRGAYPIKVNQQHRVVQAVLDGSPQNPIGLEAGSKPELMIAMGLQKRGELILCNGFKDAEYLRTALHAQALGLDVIVIIERFDELPILLDLIQPGDARPKIGLRARLRGQGSGKWAASSGDRSKFGLTSAEMLTAVELLTQSDAINDLRLLHFHAGSQINDLEPLRQSLREATQLLLELRRLGANHLDFLDIGGGLAVDYDGSQTASPLSKSYSLAEYAETAIKEISTICDQAGQSHPDLITEAGRATVAHHSLLVVEVIGEDGTLHQRHQDIPTDPIPQTLQEAIVEVQSGEGDTDRVQDAIQHLNSLTRSLFERGAISLPVRAYAEGVERSALTQLRIRSRQIAPPMGLHELDNHLAETWYANFSLFQSLPDHWAIDHDFPIVPLQRLDEEPRHRVHLGDITCDSDGEIRRFVGHQQIEGFLPAHELSDAPYYLGIFLVGAYQEILGDLHNLFGDPDAVELDVTRQSVLIRDQEPGNSIQEVLGQVGYDGEALIQNIQESGNASLGAGKLSLAKLRSIIEQYRRDLMGYTYLEPVESREESP